MRCSLLLPYASWACGVYLAAAAPRVHDESSKYLIDDDSVEDMVKTAEKYNALYGNPDFTTVTELAAGQPVQQNMFVDSLANQTRPVIDEANPPPPVVIMHGLMDAGLFEIGFCIQLAWKYHAHVKCLNVDDVLASAYVNADDQLKHMTHAIQSDRTLVRHAAVNNQGFFLVGISQGGTLVRAYVERVNKPVVKRLLSWTGVQNGIATCPAAVNPKLCSRFEGGLLSGPYNSFLIFSDYWRDPRNKTEYLRQNRFLADLNNEQREGCFHSKSAQNCNLSGPRVINEQYRSNIKNLDWYVQIEATADSMIYPHISESHGEYQWGREGDRHDNLNTTEMEHTPEYEEDAIGLKTLNEAGKIRRWLYVGEHVQVPYPMWEQWLKPFLGGGVPAPSGWWGAASAAKEMVV